MITLVQGRTVTFVLCIGMIIVITIFARRAKKGKLPRIRKLPPLEAVDEAVQRAAEMGRPVHFTTGYGGGGLSTEWGIYHLPGLAVLGRVAELTAKYDIPLYSTFCHPELVPLAEDIIKTAYTKVGKPEAVKPEMAQLVGGQQFSYAMGVMGLLLDKRPAANIMVGNFWAESLLIAETGNIVGAFQIGGAGEVTALPMLVAACDHVLMFEELFAAQAYLTKEPRLAGSIAAQDIYKIIALILCAIGIIFATIGIDWSWLLAL